MSDYRVELADELPLELRMRELLATWREAIQNRHNAQHPWDVCPSCQQLNMCANQLEEVLTPYVSPPELITKEDGTPIGIRQKVHLGGKGGATP